MNLCPRTCAQKDGPTTDSSLTYFYYTTITFLDFQFGIKPLEIKKLLLTNQAHPNKT
jgi:hypothetical protein